MFQLIIKKERKKERINVLKNWNHIRKLGTCPEKSNEKMPAVMYIDRLLTTCNTSILLADYTGQVPKIIQIYYFDFNHFYRHLQSNVLKNDRNRDFNSHNSVWELFISSQNRFQNICQYFLDCNINVLTANIINIITMITMITILIAFHIALIPLGKVWIQLFSLQLWVNSRTD